ncbi:MAG: glycosyl transferase [Pseudomonadota bacterium]
MSDFHQHGTIATLHNLSQRPLEDLETQLLEFSQSRKMGLILPSLYSEIGTNALDKIVSELARVEYLDTVVVGIDRASSDQFKHAVQFFKPLPQEVCLLWQDGPRLRELDTLLKDERLAPYQEGKGRNVWYCMGYLLSQARVDCVALHDCDIVTYSRELLARLLFPVANPIFSYAFCKGYYARTTQTKMNGRANRLLVTPLLRALEIVCGPSDYLKFLDSFRYALAGEFSMQLDVLKTLKIPSDWGLEIGLLSEMHRNYSSNRICQVDIANHYDHKHQDLGDEEAAHGLARMATDIAKALYRKLATQGEVFTQEKIRTIKATYYRVALDFVGMYHNDALINGLTYDRHSEEKTVELFAQNVMQAGWDFLEYPMAQPFVPAWNRVISAMPDILPRLAEAVAQDAEEFAA